MTNLKRDLRNIDFKHINNYSLQINRWCLKPIGAWPITSTSSTLEKIVAIVLIIFCSLTIAIVTVPCILYVILEDQTITAKIGAFGPLFHRIMGSISYWTLLKRSHDIHNCIQHMEMDWQFIQRIGDRETMLQYAKFGRFLAGISAAITQGGQLLFGTARAIKTMTIMVGNETFKTRPMTCPTYSKILDTRFSPINEIMLTIQFVSAFVVSSAIVSVCSLAGVFAMHACGQLNVLYAWLNELVIDYEEKGNQSVEQKLAAIVQHHLRALSLIALITAPCVLYVLFEKVNIKQRLNVIGPLLHRLMGMINYWVLLKRSGDIHKLIRHMETDWNLAQRIDEHELMLQYAKFGRSVSIICGLIMQGGTFLFSLTRALKTTTIIVGNETFTTYPMTCPVYSKIIDTRFSPVNEIALVLQFMSTFVLSSSTVGACSLAAVFAIHACGQLNVLSIWLHELVQNQEKKNHITQKKLALIVEHHLRVLSFISCVESIMHKVSLAELMGCTTSMCLLGYYTIMAWETLDTAKLTSYFIVYLSMGFNIFIFCYIGEIITEQCKYVGEVTYMTDWYNLHHKTARDLILIIARSSNVIKITAGKLFHLSIATFGDVIKTSIAYLNLLRTMTM
ncbi:PREDICTED: odorant receptor 22c-like [Acromyrmex echinatior]|uniref:odorant receptor 22c-like n=1 Tax=Acromyrmex echinatior TaxID=103372 RepID=UPI000580EE83|nr:PREDICTED: odorant receptor 22c-like [Acromyrmex echinatior]